MIAINQANTVSIYYTLQVTFQDVMSLRYCGEGNPAKLHALDDDGNVIEELEVFDWDDFDIEFL